MHIVWTVIEIVIGLMTLSLGILAVCACIGGGMIRKEIESQGWHDRYREEAA